MQANADEGCEVKPSETYLWKSQLQYKFDSQTKAVTVQVSY